MNTYNACAIEIVSLERLSELIADGGKLDVLNEEFLRAEADEDGVFGSGIYIHDVICDNVKYSCMTARKVNYDYESNVFS